MAKKLQVFVSSTYTDLRVERQAVVEAILESGHIPAGMELFAAGDTSQLHIIQRWIEESDVYMLVLGGRYGSIEPKSGKSYVHVEYDYATELGKPHFAAVISEEYLNEKAKADGLDVLERDHPDLLRAFKEQVASKICKFFSRTDQLKLIVFQSLSAIVQEKPNLVGWVRSDQVTDVGPLADEIGQLRSENSRLQDELKQLKAAMPDELYNGYTYEQLVQRLTDTFVPRPGLQAIGDTSTVDVLSVFWAVAKKYSVEAQLFPDERVWQTRTFITNTAPELVSRGLIEVNEDGIRLNDVGKAFFARMDREGQKPQYCVRI